MRLNVPHLNIFVVDKYKTRKMAQDKTIYIYTLGSEEKNNVFNFSNIYTGKFTLLSRTIGICVFWTTCQSNDKFGIFHLI